jgi:hypothetical protein
MEVNREIGRECTRGGIKGATRSGRGGTWKAVE